MHTECMTAYAGPIVDAHVHLWNPTSTPRLVSPLVRALGWSPRLLNWATTQAFAANAQRFVGSPRHVLANYLECDWAEDAQVERASLKGFIHIEAGWQVRHPTHVARETAWLQAHCGPRLQGIVGHASLGHPQLTTTLDAHQRASPRFVGIRDKLAFSHARTVMNWSASPNVMEQVSWQRGYALLGTRGLTFDAWCFGHQLRALAKLLRAHPTTRVVLDHLGSPIGAGGRFEGVVTSEAARIRVFETWKQDLHRIAESPQIFAKISGLTMPILGFGFHTRMELVSVSEVVDKIGPFVEHALAAFTPRRCFFASNFPVDKVSLPWSTLFAAYAQLSAHLGVEAQRDLFERNAMGFYTKAKLAP